MKFATVTSQAKNQDYREIYVITYICISTQQCCMQNFEINFYKQQDLYFLILSISRFTNKNSNY